MWISLTLAAGVVMCGWSGAAVAQKRSHGAGSVDRIVGSLRAVDTAYASGNAAEAQTRFREARAAWNGVAPRISAREAREQQLLFDSLGKQLKSGAPPTQVKSTVSGMIDELHEDIERELR
jgi:hypothetical protein